MLAGAVVTDRVGRMSSDPTEISTVSPMTATWTWRRRSFDPAR
jgi:hypothetical protein